MMQTCMALSPTKALFAPLLFSGDLERGMQAASQLGYDGVEFNLLNSDSVDQEAILSWLQKYELSVPSIGTGQSYFQEGLSLADTSQEVQHKVRERMCGHIRFASRLHARVVIGSVRGKLSSGSETERQAGYHTALEAAATLGAYAAELGVELTVEPINRYETNFLNTIEETLCFIRATNCSNIGLLADTFHMNIEEADMLLSLQAAGDLLWHVHFADSNRYAPGMGHLDFQQLVRKLKEMDYQGYVSAEIIPVPDSDSAARKWMDFIRPLISRKL
ncbi:MAG: sugar phosphate isomerase/epimerase [Chloroflexi bacterium]|nr:MAG: sugar phosphate isomerase/epimerase [Chloroflexota bacterium]